MAANREPCFAALFALLETIDAFRFTSRTWQSWDDVAPSEAPAMFLAKGDEESTVIRGLPPLWKLQARVVIYAKNNQTDEDTKGSAAPSIQLNELLTAIEEKLQRDPLEGPSPEARFPNVPNGGDWGTTLGGLCYGCQISGAVQVFEGLIDGNAVMIVPIDILTTA